MNLEEMMHEYYRRVVPDFYNKNKEVVSMLTASVTTLLTRATIMSAPPIPCTFYIALLGSPRSGKSTAVRMLTILLESAEVRSIMTGTPESIVEQVSKVKHGYMFWDEAYEIYKKSKSYLDTLPYILNRMYYRDEITMGRRTKNSIILHRDEYHINIYFTALPEQWSEIESAFLGGFSRRVLKVQVEGNIPYFSLRNADPPMELMHAIAKSFRLLKLFEVRAKVDVPRELARELDYLSLDEEVKSMVEEYTYKVTVGRAIAYALEYYDDTEETAREFVKNLNYISQGLKVSHVS